MIGNPDLTDTPANKALQRSTVPGMASWGGEGPAGRTCRECQHWVKPEKEWQRWSSEHGGLNPQRCDKARRMMNGANLPKVPHDAKACRFFEFNVEAPPLFRPHR